MRKWENTYRKYLDDEKMTYSEVGEKMDSYRPGRLFKYTRFNEHWEKNLFEGQIYLSPASGLNDPFDCLAYINHKDYIERMFWESVKLFPNVNRQIIREEAENSVNEILDEFLEDVRKQLRVFCFTEKYANPLMWSHYADSHKGFCIEYDLSKIPVGFRHSIFPVIYSDERYDATQAVITQNGNLLMNPYFFKSLVWKYEREWRMVVPENVFTDKEYFADFSSGISAVYLGLRSKEFHKNEVDKILEEYTKRGIPVFEMYIDMKSYNLKKKKIN